MRQKIAVLGAGTMGHAIAASFAMGGHPVNLYSRSEASIEKGIRQIREDLDVMVSMDYISREQQEETLERITPCPNLKEAVCDRDYVIEALPEDLELKLGLLQKLDAWCPEDTILASNTSSLKLDEMAEALSEARKKRFVINHWFNPAHIVPLVELSNYGNNDQAVLDEVWQMHMDLGKQPVYVYKDIPGMLANRLQQAILREVFSLVEKGAATIEDLDRTMKYGPGFRYPIEGPVKIVDYGGSDVWCVEAGNLLPDMDDSHEPNPLFQERLQTGELGLKTGKGFYDFRGQDEAAVRAKFVENMIRQLKLSQEQFMK